MPATSPLRFLSAGETVPVSGMYRAIHLGHRGPHNVIAVKGELFPVCRTCGASVQLELLHTAQHVTHDWDFAGPNLTLVKRKKDRD